MEAWQEVFERSELRSLVEGYAAKADPASVRAKLGHMDPWLAMVAKEPAARVTWTAMMDMLAVGAEAMPEVADGNSPLDNPSPEADVELLILT